MTDPVYSTGTVSILQQREQKTRGAKKTLKLRTRSWKSWKFEKLLPLWVCSLVLHLGSSLGP